MPELSVLCPSENLAWVRIGIIPCVLPNFDRASKGEGLPEEDSDRKSGKIPNAELTMLRSNLRNRLRKIGHNDPANGVSTLAFAHAKNWLGQKSGNIVPYAQIHVYMKAGFFRQSENI